MKATGIVRKVDELGRVVIPIELRRKLNIKENDLMEIYVERDNIVLKKYENKVCSNCNQQIDEKDKYCRYCGREQSKK